MANATVPALTLDTAPDILTVPQYCALTQTGRDHVYRMIRRGDIPAIRIGGAIRIPKTVLLDQLAEVSA